MVPDGRRSDWRMLPLVWWLSTSLGVLQAWVAVNWEVEDPAHGYVVVALLPDLVGAIVIDVDFGTMARQDARAEVTRRVQRTIEQELWGR